METTRWGVLGTAQIAPSFIEGLRRSRAGEVVGVASRDLQRATKFAEVHSIEKVFDSYDALLASEDISFVYVPLPNSFHREWSIRALEAGKHVLCEKPLATNAQDAISIADAAHKANRHIAEGFMYRHHPQWMVLQSRIDDGTLGEIVSIDSWFGFPLDPEEVTPGSAALGGGALLDVGCYCVHLSRMIGGEPLRVSAMQRATTVDTSMIGIMQMRSGALARFECSIEQDERRGARITGTSATAVIERPWLPGDEGAVIRIEKNGEVVERIVTEAANCHQRQIEAFIAAAQGEAPPRWPIQDAIANAYAIDALFLAAREDRTVTLNA